MSGVSNESEIKLNPKKIHPSNTSHSPWRSIDTRKESFKTLIYCSLSTWNNKDRVHVSICILLNTRNAFQGVKHDQVMILVIS